METTIVVATEAEVRRLIKESLKEILETAKPKEVLVTNVSEPLIDLATVRNELSVCSVTLRAWRKSGLPSYKQGRKVYFLLSEVKEFMTHKKPKKKYEWF